MQHKCKNENCNTQTTNKMYCSNECKFSCQELRKTRARKLKNELNKRLHCKECNWSTKDINNLGGYAKKHLKSVHNLIVDEYLQYYTIKDDELDFRQKLQCPECNWNTIDLENKSGQFTVHIKNAHGYNDYTDFLKIHPSYDYLWNRLLFNLDKKITNTDYVVCKECNKKMEKISNTHLKHAHNMTTLEYKEKYPFDSQIINNRLHTLHSTSTTKLNKTRKNVYRSQPEKDIQKFLEDNNIKTVPTYKDLGIEIDLYIPEFNLAIEYNGMRYHSEFFGKKSKMYHLNKTEICNKNNIRLIHIFEDEWIYKRDIVKSKLLNLCNITQTKVYARKCIVKIITNKVAAEFCNNNHIQGSGKGFIHLGLFHEDKLKSVMVISNLRKSLGQNKSNDVYELNRYCSELGTNIVGGFSKLIKYIKIHYLQIKQLISYADLRWSSQYNNVYIKSDFILEKINTPNYWYVIGNKRYHRYNFTKGRIVQLGGDESKTEIENMLLAGFDRIWDCGTLKYSLDLN